MEMMLDDLLVRTPDFREMDAPDIRLTAALRLWMVLTRLGLCPMPAVAGRLASAGAAVRLHILLEEIGAAWPEPFCVAPPCCSRLSHDEALASRWSAPPPRRIARPSTACSRKCSPPTPATGFSRRPGRWGGC
ncbi:MAG TPA: hypothetical protein VGO55_17875 [Allosphingosinicella sp.]|jgi:hypothetical protein|nr:hypothetical protein [Allosphingosinicella sp.]